MRKFIVAALAALVAGVSIGNARDDEPRPEVMKEFAFNYMRQFSQQTASPISSRSPRSTRASFA